MRHPMKWEDEEQPTGVFLGGPSAETAELFQMPPAVRRVDRLTLPGTAAGLQDVAALLERVRQALARLHRRNGTGAVPVWPPRRSRLALLDDALGEGEVGMIVAGAAEYQIQESVLPGVWRVKTFEPAGKPISDHVEVAEVPSVVRAAAIAATRPELIIGDPPSGCMNVMPVLADCAPARRRTIPASPTMSSALPCSP